MRRIRTTLFPTLDEVLYLHSILLERFGGGGGIRDKGLLESALARPRTGYYATLTEQAAALMQSLALNHAFVDGNKRVSFAVTVIFLTMNGYTLEVEPGPAEKFIRRDLIKNKVELEIITRWIEKHIKPL